ncbi:MAG: nucleotidyltransferase domain-containing protein [Deltaproteobacteria bacterium]|nr:nucleotidyltransferase domain-containing protein [Deltaproteobacteria bacterium]
MHDISAIRFGLIICHYVSLIFGSYAKGSPKEESDIDIAIISGAFTGDRFEDRRRIVPLRRKIDSRLEPIPFRPEDFYKGGNLVDEIKRTGKVIKGGLAFSR